MILVSHLSMNVPILPALLTGSIGLGEKFMNETEWVYKQLDILNEYYKDLLK